MKHHIIIITFLLLSGAAAAQPLDSLIAIAMGNNPELRGLFLEYRAALEQGPQVSELPDPEVGVGVSILPVETRLGPQWVRLGVTQMFPWVGTLKAREDVVLTMARSKYERAEALKQELAYKVKQAYLQLYDLRRRREVIRRNLRFYRGMEEMALIKVESGETTLADVLSVQLKIQELSKQLELLENREAKPQAMLNQVLNRSVQTPVQVRDTLATATLVLDREALDTIIQQNHPALKALDWQQEASRQAIELNALSRKPSFGAGIDYILTGGRSDAEPANNGRDALGLRGMIKIPLFTKKYDAKEQEEQLKIEALEHQKESLQSKFMAAIEQAYADYRDALLQLELYQQQKETLQSAIDILTTRYSTEGRGFDELLRLQAEQVNYDLKALQAIVQSHLAVIEVERLTEFGY